jgi:hypothetical protein
MQDGLYKNLSNKCKSVIKNNNPNQSINLISKMKSPGNGEKIGREKALKIYNAYSDNSVNYDSNTYKNNISSYKNKVNSNINKANKYAQT